ISDRASWEFADLRSRVTSLERREELEAQDLLRAQVVARIVSEAWLGTGLSQAPWRELQQALHEEFALLVEEAYHETNRWLVERGVLPEVDLRPLIRRTRDAGVGGRAGAPTAMGGGSFPSTRRATGMSDETQPLTRPYAQAEEV